MQMDIHEDIHLARLPPSTFYTGRAWHAYLIEHVWRKSWSFMETRPPKKPGFKSTTLLPGAAQEELVWSHAADGQTRLLSNACTHRAAQMLSGESKRLRCPYHGRQFDSQGKVCKAPGFPSGHPAFQDRLPEARWGSLGPLIFASIHPAISLETLLRPIEDRIGFLLNRMPNDPVETQRFTRDTSWLVYCDNFLEGLHIPFVHPALSQSVDISTYQVHLLPWGSVQIAQARPGDPAIIPPPGHPEEGQRIAAWYFWLFPGTMLNVYPWGISVNQVYPLGPEKMSVVFEAWCWDEDLRQKGAGSDLAQVEQEDAEVVLKVAQGHRNTLAVRGRYAPTAERAVHHFHRLIQDQLSPVDGTV